EIAASVLPAEAVKEDAIPEEVIQEVDDAVERQQAEQLDWLRRRPAFFLDTDSQDAAYDPAFYPRRPFPWAALYPTPPLQAQVMPQDEILPFETPQTAITHAPPLPTPPQQVADKPLEEDVPVETPPTVTPHGLEETDLQKPSLGE